MIEQEGPNCKFPIYLPISEYSKTFVITPEIYNLQIERLGISQKILENFLVQKSDEVTEFIVKSVFGSLAKLIIEKSIKKDPKKRVGWMPVCLFEWNSKGHEDYWCGSEDEIGNSMVVGGFDVEESKPARQMVAHSLLPEAGIDIFDAGNLFRRLASFKNDGFSKLVHLRENHDLNQECTIKNCLVGLHFLPTIVPGVLLHVEVLGVGGNSRIEVVSLCFAKSEYQEE